MREVRYRGYGIDVPGSWPVYELAADPSRCVRFDRHAVYLGRPGPNQRCPAHAVGRTEAILIEPLNDAATQPDRITVSGPRVTPRPCRERPRVRRSSPSHRQACR